jgi:spermidine synthase
MADPSESDMWIKEIHQGIIGIEFKVDRTLFSGTSPYQRIEILETVGHGRILVNDGAFMLSERDEFVYHEMIAHVPLFVHPAPARVLIIGGGDGGTAREVLRHPGVDRAVMIEIDEMVIAACREHLPTLSSALDDPRLELIIGDGVEYVAAGNEIFDVVIVDSTDPVGPARPLFGAEFYRNVARILSPDGILITQAESAFYDQDLQRRLLGRQRSHFRRIHLYLYSNLTYPGALWGFGFASKGLCPIADFDPGRFRSAGISTRYYNPGVHRGAFRLPNFVKENLAGVIDPVPDSQPGRREPHRTF